MRGYNRSIQYPDIILNPFSKPNLFILKSKSKSLRRTAVIPISTISPAWIFWGYLILYQRLSNWIKDTQQVGCLLIKPHVSVSIKVIPIRANQDSNYPAWRVTIRPNWRTRCHKFLHLGVFWIKFVKWTIDSIYNPHITWRSNQYIGWGASANR